MPDIVTPLLIDANATREFVRDLITSADRLNASAQEDALMDRIFQDEQNDLVVPTEGVATAAGPCFPIAAENMLVLHAGVGVTHTTYFGNQAVRDRLRTWLTG